MFAYEKRLQFPVKIKNTNPDIARLIMSQYGGPDGELSASMRYLASSSCRDSFYFFGIPV